MSGDLNDATFPEPKRSEAIEYKKVSIDLNRTGVERLSASQAAWEIDRPRLRCCWTPVATLAGVRAARAQAADGGTPAPAPERRRSATRRRRAARGGAGRNGRRTVRAEPGRHRRERGSARPPTAPKAPFTLNGYVRGDMFVGKVPDVRAAEMKANYGELALQLRTAKSAFGDGFADARIRYGLQGSATGTFVDLREAYVNALPRAVRPAPRQADHRVGTRRRAEPDQQPDAGRLPHPLAAGGRHPPGQRRRARVPAPRRRAPRRRLDAVYLATELPNVGLPPVRDFGPPMFPSLDLSNGLVAGRIHLELPAFEMSISYLRGYRAPTRPDADRVAFSMTDPVAARVADGVQPAGARLRLLDGARRRADPARRGRLPPAVRLAEPALRRAPRRAVRPGRRPHLRIGERHRSVPGPLRVQLAERAGDESGPGRAGGHPGGPGQRGGLHGSRSPPKSTPSSRRSTRSCSRRRRACSTSPRCASNGWRCTRRCRSRRCACYNFTTKEWLVTPRIGWKLTDAMTALVGAQVFAGPNDTLFGLIDQNLSAGYVELRFSF